MKNTVVVGLGSNVQPQKNIAEVRDMIAERFKVLATSKFVATKPIGMTQPGDFLNGAILIETELAQDDLRSVLKEMEKKLGRVSTSEKYGPRTIDIDILTWNGSVIDQDFYERDFVKNSVLELCPQVKY